MEIVRTLNVNNEYGELILKAIGMENQKVSKITIEIEAMNLIKITIIKYPHSKNSDLDNFGNTILDILKEAK